MDNFIGDYITSKLGRFSNPTVKRTGNKYVCQYVTYNKHFNSCEYRRFKYGSNENVPAAVIVGAFIVALTGLLCLIPHILGVIGFTLIHLVIILVIMQDNRYDALVCGSIWICLFLIAVFCIHFIFAANFMDTPEYKAFHTIYPEYLFKFKFK